MPVLFAFFVLFRPDFIYCAPYLNKIADTIEGFDLGTLINFFTLASLTEL